MFHRFGYLLDLARLYVLVACLTWLVALLTEVGLLGSLSVCAEDMLWAYHF